MNMAKAVLEAKVNPHLTFEMVEHELRRRHYGVLCTISQDGRPHSAGVTYAVSAPIRPFGLYVVTDGRSKKARNIARNSNISFAVPVHRSPGFLPPGSIQFQAQAEIVALTDNGAREAFNASLVTKSILRMQLQQKRDVSTFLYIRPNPVMFTYGIGMTIFELAKHFEEGAARVVIPESRLGCRPKH
jgi:hypothetical protein